MYDNKSKRSLTPIDFESIENEKENVLPLRAGRSARGLTEALQQSATTKCQIRANFERRLIDDLGNMADPLELYLEYIDWISLAYPQSGTTKKNGLLDIVERCLIHFKDNEQYKNDARYLKIWLWYNELFFANERREQRDIFIFLLRMSIGFKLTKFYQAFSDLLVDMKRYDEAYQVLKRGIENQATPVNEMLDSLQNFEDQILEKRINIDDNFSIEEQFSEATAPLILGRQRSEIITPDQQPTENDNDTSESSKNEKMSIFMDSQSQGSSKLYFYNDEESQFMDLKSNKTKENKIAPVALEANTNIGILSQGIRPSIPVEKAIVFKDEIGRADPVYEIVEELGRKPERIECNFKLIYPNKIEEYSIEEILARSRGIYHKMETSGRIPSEDVEDFHPAKRIKT